MLRTADLDASRDFYLDFLGFEVAMDEVGFLMLRSPSTPTTQVIVLSDDAADREALSVDVSLEVADVDAAYADAQRRGLEIVKPLTDESWGIRRFFVKDPDGRVLNVASHAGS